MASDLECLPRWHSGLEIFWGARRSGRDEARARLALQVQLFSSLGGRSLSLGLLRGKLGPVKASKWSDHRLEKAGKTVSPALRKQQGEGTLKTFSLKTTVASRLRYICREMGKVDRILGKIVAVNVGHNKL